MNIQKIKTKLITAVGFKAVAYLQALRFLYLLKTDKSPDPEVMLLKRFLRKGDTAVDIGANAANWTYYLYNSIGSEGNLYAFEADPYYGYATEIAIKMMGLKGVHFFSFGLSNKSENVPLRIMYSNGLRFSGLGYIDK